MITSVRDPLLRSISHFGFDNFHCKNNNHAKSSRQSTERHFLTYNEWYRNFGTDNRQQNAGCVCTFELSIQHNMLHAMVYDLQYILNICRWEYVKDIETIWINNHMTRYIGGSDEVDELPVIDDETKMQAFVQALLSPFHFILLTEKLNIGLHILLCNLLMLTVGYPFFYYLCAVMLISTFRIMYRFLYFIVRNDCFDILFITGQGDTH